MSSKVDWAQRVEFDEAPIRKDIYIFYQQFLGHYPQCGLHYLYLHPEVRADHLNKIVRDIQERLPANFDGYVCIDYECWNILWERLVNNPNPSGKPDDLDSDYKDDWRDWIKSSHPEWSSLSPAEQEELRRVTYNDAAKDFIMSTFQKCKELRPKAKWGYFDGHGTIYGGTPFGVIGYPPDGRAAASQLNDKAKWFFEVQDVIFPCLTASSKPFPRASAPTSRRHQLHRGQPPVPDVQRPRGGPPRRGQARHRVLLGPLHEPVRELRRRDHQRHQSQGLPRASSAGRRVRRRDLGQR